MKAVWKGISKKFDWLGISGFSMVCAGFAVVFTSPLEPLHLSIPDKNVLFSPH
ncbi:DUF3693 domain-containing protein [Vibrio parahaemolyticus]|nr:DUF3693 domain-containing protein [Vibrio parahaemolyticus]